MAWTATSTRPISFWGDCLEICRDAPAGSSSSKRLLPAADGGCAQARARAGLGIPTQRVSER